MSTSADFSLLTTATPLAEGQFSIEVPDGWQQGRGAFGGLVVATLFRAARTAEPEPQRTLRSLTAELAGPLLPGPARIQVEMLRRGAGVSTVAARVLQNDELAAHAVVVLGKARAGLATWNRLSPPRPPPFDQVKSLSAAAMPMAPFARHIDFRPIGPLPFSGPSAPPIAAGWLRLREPVAVLTAAELLAMVDAWWPGVLVSETTPRPMATLAYTFELLVDPAQLDPTAPLFHHAETIASHEGYNVEMRQLWSESGHLLALNQQTIATIK